MSALFKLPKNRLNGNGSVLVEESFLQMLYLERKRADRSGKSLLLLLLDIRGACSGAGGLDRRRTHLVLESLAASTRETDVTGWYKSNAVVGAILTEVCPEPAVVSMIRERVRNALLSRLNSKTVAAIRISVHMYPAGDGSREGDGVLVADPVVYPEATQRPPLDRSSRLVKRAIDLTGSIGLVVLLAPVFLIVAVLVKLTSKGPVFFRQERVGLLGNRFMLLKFRSMRIGADPRVHREFVEQFIRSGAQAAHSGAPGSPGGVYKLTRDPRITPLGKFLRKSSLDELPQLFNVVRGEMSLVGPRPPIPYEYKCYAPWHRRRVLDAKPGITGLWQVKGRSRSTFDEMVRLDLSYIDNWGLWKDIKILLQTPWVVFLGKGAC